MPGELGSNCLAVSLGLVDRGSGSALRGSAAQLLVVYDFQPLDEADQLDIKSPSVDLLIS